MSDLLILAQTHEIHAGDGGWWADTAGIMLVLPFVAFALILIFGKRMKNNGGEIAIAALAINLVWATVLMVRRRNVSMSLRHRGGGNQAAIASMHTDFGFRGHSGAGRIYERREYEAGDRR